jgi:hypothetical protein
MSAEETTALKEFEKEWPDIAKAQEIAVKRAVYNGVQYTLNALAKAYNPTLQRFSELSDVMQEQLALSAIRNQHSDYDKIYDDVVKWVDKLPAAFRKSAKETLESGTVEDANELIAEYKKAHPAAAAPLAVAATPAAPATTSKAELSAAAKKAASKLSMVGSKRSTPVTAADANDFDGAWAEAVETK